MQVETIQCQIAQAQIGNFLAGSGLSDEAMSQLEEHISQCPTCKAALAEKRSELKAMLSQEKAVVSADEIFRLNEEHSAATSIAAALRKKTLEQLSQPSADVKSTPSTVAAVEMTIAAEVATSPAKKLKLPKEPKPVRPAKNPKAAAAVATPTVTGKPNSAWKPLLYSLALGAVLVGMSLFSNNLSSLFGPKANDSKAMVSTTATETPAPSASTEPPQSAPINPPASTTLAGPGTTEASSATQPIETTSSTTPNTPLPESNSVPEDNAWDLGIGTTAGSLSTTQFPAVEPSKPIQPVQKPANTPKAASKPKTVARKTTAKRRPVIRKSIRRPVSKPKSHGITVYQP